MKNTRPKIAAYLCAVSALTLAGCAPLHYSLRSSGGRLWMLPPKMTEPPAALAGAPVQDCTNPLSPGGAHFSVYGCYPSTGFVDLQPGMRVKVVRPVTADGQPLKTEVVSQQGLSLSVKTNISGVKTDYYELAEGKPFWDFPASLRYFRLFLQARLTANDRNITLIGHATREGLETAAGQLDAYCRDNTGACMAVAYGMVIAPELPVAVNGKQQFIALGGVLHEVLPERGAVPVGLRWLRLWKGKLVPVVLPTETQRLHGVPLNAGDRLSW